ncbi:DUF3667 domain-containing protein (plasmid) [Pseudoalteromonas sp. T1lg65]|uniref:DUF3667 domain-containing protein n=1 Tax=Pseudoalteromonas sp. T1lg65 TaxID=2077101 RepID=UPI003F7AE43B
MDFERQTHCLNCQAPLDTPFCGQCSQEKVRRIQFSELFRLIQEGILELRSPFLQLMWGMTTQPIATIKGYLNGERTKYFNPIKYAFLIFTALLILLALFDITFIPPEALLDSDNDQQFQSIFNEYLSSTLLYQSFLLPFFSALGAKLALRKKTFNVAELYIAHLLLSTQLAIVSAPFYFAELHFTQIFSFVSIAITLFFTTWMSLLLRKSNGSSIKDGALIVLCVTFSQLLAIILLSILLAAFAGFQVTQLEQIQTGS